MEKTVDKKLNKQSQDLDELLDGDKEKKKKGT